ncbi:Histidine-containing phosphotransfer protein 4 [Bienertia sinuspersici]
MQGILDENFLTLELVEASKPNFVEKTIPSYFSISAGFMNELQHILDSEPLDLKNVERLIHKIMGGSGSMGAAKLHAVSGEMLELFKARALDRLKAAFEKIKDEHSALKMHLGPYAELLKQLRLAGPPNEGSDNQEEDVESIASNDVNND